MITHKTRWLLAGLVCLTLAAAAYTLVRGGHWETLNATGIEAYERGDYSEAEKQWSAALKEADEFGAEDPRLATSLNNLADLYRLQGRYAEAEPLYKRSLEILEKALGAEHPDVATSLNNLAEVYRAQGRYAEAEPLYERSLAIREKALGAGHPHVALSLENYSALLRETGRGSEAVKLETRARAIRAKRAR